MKIERSLGLYFRMMQITKYILTAFLALSSLTLWAQDFDTERTTYKRGDDFNLRLYGFAPADYDRVTKRAAIIFFFGDGWTDGDPRQFFQQADFFAKQGLVAFSAEYRVENRYGTTPFDAVEDAKSVVRWVRKNAEKMGIDPNLIIVAGGSAGGHIAGCTGIIKGLEAEGEDYTVSSVPNAMILFNPVLDTTETGYGLEQVGEDRKTEVSLTHHVHAGIVPTLVIHGTEDKTVPFENAERFQKLMKEAGNDSELIAVEGQGHDFFNSPFYRPQMKDTKLYDQCLADTLSFLKKHKFIK